MIVLQKVLSSSDWRHLNNVVSRIKIGGELPRLYVSISDQRLQEILNLVQSIPFPEGAPPPPEDEYDAVDIENIPLEIVDNMKAKQVLTEVTKTV